VESNGQFRAMKLRFMRLFVFGWTVLATSNWIKVRKTRSQGAF